MTEHTKVPWKVVDKKQIRSLSTNDGVAELSMYSPLENAQFIVRAVNCHDELLDMLTIALPYVEDAMDDPVNKKAAVSKVVKQIREAIAKAEGKEQS